MEINKILTGKERLSLKTFFQLSKPNEIEFKLGTAGRFLDLRTWG